MGLNCLTEVHNQFLIFLPNTPLRDHCVVVIVMRIRGDFKYYFAGFVRKGGGDPQIRNPLFTEFFSVNEGGGSTPQIRNLFFGPKSVVF